MDELIQALKQIQTQAQAIYEEVENIKGAFPYSESLQAKCQKIMDAVDDLSLDIQHFIDFDLNGGVLNDRYREV